MKTTYDMVSEFHAKFGVPNPGTVDISGDRELRLSLIEEELQELREALAANDPVAVADALADLDYVVAGAALRWGIPHDRVVAEVHRSNMTKDGGGTRSDGKILKGPDYEPPDIERVFREECK